MPPPLYRGVPKNTQRGGEALLGIVQPRGVSTDYQAQVLGADCETDVTSCTTDPVVASRFGEIVLVIDADLVHGQIVDHPSPTRYPQEQEVLIRGRFEKVGRYK